MWEINEITNTTNRKGTKGIVQWELEKWKLSG